MKAQDNASNKNLKQQGKDNTNNTIAEFCNPKPDKKTEKKAAKKAKKNRDNDLAITEKPIMTETEIKQRKGKKTRVALSCFVLILAVGVVGNWYWENSDISTKINTVSSQKTKTLGEATFVDATTEKPTENEYFSSARVERQSARDASLEKLQKVIDSVDESEAAHKDAADKIAKISEYISIENKIETLVTAKGVSNCIAVINESGKKVDVIVDAQELSDALILQVKEIAVSQLGCTYENVTIIQSK